MTRSSSLVDRAAPSDGAFRPGSSFLLAEPVEGQPPASSAGHDDGERVRELHRYEILDTDPERVFDDMVDLARLCFGSSSSVISLVDADRQWFKATAGSETRETARDISFCTHAIMSSETLVVLDAQQDSRFATSPLVLGPPYTRFYAGHPLITPSGFRIGSFCVFDPQPRESFGTEERRQLAAFAGIAMERLEARRLRSESRREVGFVGEMADAVNAAARELDGQARHLDGLADVGAERTRAACAGLYELDAAGARVETAVSRILDMIADATERTDRSAGVLEDLALHVRGVVHLVRDVEAIASTSRLLSINASIEAGRSGDSGRGFAVVAAEMRQLSQRAATAAGQAVNELRALEGALRNVVAHSGTVSDKMREIVAETGEVRGAAQHQAGTRAEIGDEIKQMVVTVAGVERATEVLKSASAGLVLHASSLQERARLLLG